MPGEPFNLGPIDPALVDALWAYMQPAWTEESETLLKVVETDPDWLVVADSFGGRGGVAADPDDDRLCPECGALWNSIYFRMWEEGDQGICIDTFYCPAGHIWTTSSFRLRNLND
ncbi:hypothetical protein [Mycobacterium marinum]|uniref:hypothetical protein n=1 Tax=Mycobacterium marinum TaxID=1781 RepID=UPI0011406279|nr:hypothetical protein [Mycobacterium marinum]